MPNRVVLELFLDPSQFTLERNCMCRSVPGARGDEDERRFSEPQNRRNLIWR